MNIQHFSTRHLLIIASIFLLCSCTDNVQQKGLASDGKEAADKAAAEAVLSKADRDWKELTSSGARPERLPGESDLAYFLREVEFADHRRRELGLKFWDAYPDDSRRYSWLQLTVHMPPHYATDIKAWAEKETDHMNPNDTPIDTSAKSLWDKRYPKIRAAFFASPTVTEKDKRFFWFGELQQALERLQEAHARGENIDTAPFLASYADFVANYSIPFSNEGATEAGQGIKELDEHKVHARLLRKLWEDVFDHNRKLFSWTPQSAKAFAGEMAPSLKEGSYITIWIDRLQEHIASHESLPEVRRRNFQTTNENEVPWLMLLNKYNLLTGIRDTPEAQIVSAYWSVIGREKKRGIGERLWHTHPDKKMQSQWYGSTIMQPPDYTAAFVDAVRLIADGQKSQIEMDSAAQKSGEERLAELRKAFFSDSDTSEAQKVRWLEHEIRASKTKLDKSPSAIAQYFDSVKALAKMGEREASGFVKDIVYNPRRYGLDDEKLDAFVAEFRKYEHEYMRYVVDLHDRRKTWKSQPVEFTVPLFNGDGELSLADLRGKIVYVHSWSTWCSPCIAKMPEMHETYLKYKDKGFVPISVVYDSNLNPKGVQRVIDKLNFGFPLGIGHDDEQALQVNNQYMVLNRDGTVYEYYDNKHRKLSDILDEMLAAEQQDK